MSISPEFQAFVNSLRRVVKKPEEALALATRTCPECLAAAPKAATLSRS